MNSKLLREAVGYADGWQTTRLGNQRIKVFAPHGEGGESPLTDIGYIDQQHVLAALASQLISQIDAMDDYWVCVGDDRVIIQHETEDFVVGLIQKERPYNRDENSIQACVEFFRGRKDE